MAPQRVVQVRLFPGVLRHPVGVVDEALHPEADVVREGGVVDPPELLPRGADEEVSETPRPSRDERDTLSADLGGVLAEPFDAFPFDEAAGAGWCPAASVGGQLVAEDVEDLLDACLPGFSGGDLE